LCQLLSKGCQVPLGVALAQVNGQVGAEPGEVAITAERRRTKGAAHMMNDALCCLLDLGTYAAHRQTGVCLRMLINPGGALVQPGPCGGQRPVNGAEVGVTVGVRACLAPLLM